MSKSQAQTTQPTDAECIDKIISDPESAYRAMLNQDAEIERLRGALLWIKPLVIGDGIHRVINDALKDQTP